VSLTGKRNWPNFELE